MLANSMSKYAATLKLKINKIWEAIFNVKENITSEFYISQNTQSDIISKL